MNYIKLPKWSVISTGVISFLVTTTSLLGLFSSKPYALETENWLLQARGQDLGNLLAVVVLLFSTYLVLKGSLRAYFVWLGTLFYLLYAYIIYSVAVHFNSLFLVYVAVLGLTFFTILAAVSQGIVALNLPRVNKFASYTLIVIGLLFALLWLGEIIPAIVTGETPQAIKDAGLWVNPVHVLDLSIILPGFISTGYLALRSKKVGAYLLAPWLTFSALMGSSIIAAMALMIINGFKDLVIPMVMVSVVVVASVFALASFLKNISYDAKHA